MRPNEPDWGDASHSIAFTLHDYPGDQDLYVIVNAYWEPLEFELPPLPKGLCWKRAIDTALPAPEDLAMRGRKSQLVGRAIQRPSGRWWCW